MHNWWRTRALGFHQKIRERRNDHKIRKKTRGSQLVLYKNITLFSSHAILTIAQSKQNQRFICSKLACIEYIVSIFHQNTKLKIYMFKISLYKVSCPFSSKYKSHILYQNSVTQSIKYCKIQIQIFICYILHKFLTDGSYS